MEVSYFALFHCSLEHGLSLVPTRNSIIHNWIFFESIEVKLCLLEFTIAQWPLWKRSSFVMFPQAPIFYSISCLAPPTSSQFWDWDIILQNNSLMEMQLDGRSFDALSFIVLICGCNCLWRLFALWCMRCFWIELIIFRHIHYYTILQNFFGFFLLFWRNMLCLSGFCK